MYELELNKFDPRILNKKRLSGHSPICIFIAKRGSGKSIGVVDLLYNMKDVKQIVCFSATESCNKFYQNYIHPLFIYEKFDKEVVSSIVARQKKIINAIQSRGEDHAKYTKDISIILVIDDCGYDKDIWKLEAMREIFYNGRHLCITMIMTFQYLVDIPPNYRTQIDYVFVSKENKKNMIKKFYDHFFGMFDKQVDFEKVLNQCTNDYSLLVLDTVVKSNKIEDQIFWYKANPDRIFKICPEKWPVWSELLEVEQNRENQIIKQTKSDIIVKKKGSKHYEED